MKINELETQLNEFTIALNYAADKTEHAVEELKAVKDVEIGLKEATERIKKQSEELESRIAKTVAEQVLANLYPFFENSRKIRESAEAIHQANINIQNYAQRNCKTKAFIAGALGLIIGATLAYTSLFIS